MPYFSGVITGIALTVLVAFLIDHRGPHDSGTELVNWDYVATSLGSSVEKVGQEVRREVHDATE